MGRDMEKYREWRHQNYLKNPEKFKARAKAYRAKNPEKKREQDRKYWEEHKDRRQEIARRYANSLKGRLKTYKNGARNRGLSWNISDEEFARITSTPCRWCGGPGRGLDRVNNSVGYEPSNVQSCCTACNYARGELSEQEFMELIDRIYGHLHQMK